MFLDHSLLLSFKSLYLVPWDRGNIDPVTVCHSFKHVTVYSRYYFLFNISTPCIISMFWLVTPLVDGQQTDPPYDGQTESCESIYSITRWTRGYLHSQWVLATSLFW